MKKVELLEVLDTFEIKNMGVLVMPSFDLPPQRKWVPLKELVTIKYPSGKQIEVAALFSVIHFNLRAPEVDVNQRWQIVVSFAALTKEDLPVGSKILVSKSGYEAVYGPAA